MTPQEVIKKFMARLANHGFASSTENLGTAMLDAAVRDSSRFGTIQAVIDAMKADQANAEREAVEEVLGSEYAGKLMSEVDSSILSADAKNYDGAKSSNAYLNDSNDNRSTVENVIKERKAYIFLEKYCGIQPEKKYWFNANGEITYYSGDSGTTGNVDTGAITGADANISLKAGDKDFYGTTLTDENLRALDANHQNGETLVLGTGTEKTERSVVPEISINTYTATTTSAQIINTGTRNWVVQATAADDTITADGADSINAGAGDDSITVNGSGTTVTGGAGSDKIEISAQVNNVTITDLKAEDVMTINGSFEIGAAKIEDMLLVITDKTGTRKLKLGDFENSFSGTVNVGGASTTISKWLSDSGIKLDDLTEANNTDYSAQWLSSNVTDDGRIAPDDDYKVKPLPTTEEIPRREQPTTQYSSNTTGEPPTVNLDNFTTLGAGENVNLDGQNVGTVSSTFPATNTFTRNGLTIHLLGTSTTSSAANITACTYDQLNDAQKAIVAGLFKWWAADCLNLDEKTYGISFNSDTAMNKEIGLYFYTDESSSTLAAVGNSQRTSSDGFCTKLTLNVNMKYYSTVNESDVDGESSGGLLDRTLAHEFVHALMASNINYFQKLPQFITEGTAELAHGIDDERGSRIFDIAYTDSRLNDALVMESGTGTNDAYAGGFMFLRYFAKQAALQTLLKSAYGDITANVDLSNFQNGDSLYADDSGNVTTTNTDGYLLGSITDSTYTVNADCPVKQNISTSTNISRVTGLNANTTLTDASNDNYLELAEGANLINSGAGNDTLSVTGQYATINTGAGNDSISIVVGGRHSIDLGDGDNHLTFGFGYGNSVTSGADADFISITGGIGNRISAGDGNDSIITYNNTGTTDNLFDAGAGNDKITVGAGSNNTFLGGAGDDSFSLRNFGTAYTTVISGNLIDAGAGNDTINVYSSTLNTINAGAGDDSILINGSSSNHFHFGEYFGDDTISGITANDTIHVSSDATTLLSGSILTVKSGTTTLGTINFEYYNIDLNSLKLVKDLAQAAAGLTLDGAGTAASPYLIATATDLTTFANYVNGGSATENLHFKLTADITLNGAWTSVGTYVAGRNDNISFKGTFDGDGKTISNLSGTGGLFAYIGTGGSVQNLTVNANINGIEGNIGGIANYNFGTVSGCAVTGQVNGSNCYVGGIVGQNEGSVKDCLMFVSNASDEITAGAIVNSNVSTQEPTNSYRVGTEKFSSSDKTTLAYSVTLPEGVTASANRGVSYGKNFYAPANTEITLSAAPGSYLKDNTGHYSSTATITVTNGDLDISNTYTVYTPPAIGDLLFTFDEQTQKGYYQISSADDLNALATYVNAGNDCADLDFTCTADIALPDGYTLTDFAGTIDGGGHFLDNVNTQLGTVSNLYYHGDVTLNGGTKLYALNIPDHVTIDGTQYTYNNTIYAAGDITLGTNDGYIFDDGVTTTYTITEDNQTLSNPIRGARDTNGILWKLVNNVLTIGGDYSNDLLTTEEFNSLIEINVPVNKFATTLNALSAQKDKLKVLGGGFTLTGTTDGKATLDITAMPNTIPWSAAASVVTTVNLPDAITSIPANAFANFTALTSITIPASVTEIGNGAFSGSGLTSITLPATVTTIGDSAFSNCTNLTTITAGKENCALVMNGKKVFGTGTLNIKDALTDDVTLSYPALSDGKIVLESSYTDLAAGDYLAVNVTANVKLGGTTNLYLSGNATLTVDDLSKLDVKLDTYTKAISGTDVTLTVGDNTLTLKDAAKSDTLKINGTTVGTWFDLDTDGAFLLKTAADFTALATYCNLNSSAGKTFKLAANIALPDGYTLTNFAGTIDGNGNLLTGVNAELSGTVSNLYYHGTATLTGGTKTFAITIDATPTSDGIKVDDTFYAAANVALKTDSYLVTADKKIYKDDYTPTADATLSTFTPPEIADYTYDDTTHTLNYTITTAEQLNKINDCDDCTSLTFTLNANLALPENFNLHGGTLNGNEKLLTNVNAELGGAVQNLFFHGEATIDGAKKVFTLNASDHFTIDTATSDGLHNFDGVNYFEQGAAVTFTLTADDTHRVVNDGFSYSTTITGGATLDVPYHIQLAANDTYTVTDSNVEVYGTDGADTFNISGSNVTVCGFDHSDTVKCAATTLEAAGDDVKAGDVLLRGVKDISAAATLWTVDDEHVGKYGAGTSEGVSLSGGQITWAAAKVDGVDVQLSGLSAAPEVSNSTVNITADNFSGEEISVTKAEGFGFNLSGDLSNKKFIGNASNITLAGNGATIDFGTGYNKVTVADGVTNLTAENFAADDTLAFAEDVTATAYAEDKLTITAGGKEVSISGLPEPNREDNTWLSATTYGKTAGTEYILDGTTLKFTTADAEVYFTLSGLLGGVTVDEVKAAITVDDGSVTFNSANVLDAGKQVSIAGNYTLEIGGDIPKSTAQQGATWTRANDKFTYVDATYTAGWRLDGNGKILIHETGAGKSFTISGLNSEATLGDDTVKVTGTTVTIFSKAFTADHATISLTTTDDFTLEVTDNLVETINFAANGNSVTLAGSSAGYAKVNGAYEWQAQIGGETLTITGLKENAALTEEMFTRSGDSITFKPSDDLLPENPATISITGGVIDTSSLTTTDAIGAHWLGTTWLSEQTASSWTSGTSEVTFTPAGGGEELFSIIGLKDGANLANPELVNDAYKVTLAADTFDKGGAITVTKIKSAATPEFEGIGTAAENVAAKLTAAGVYTSAHTSEYFAPTTDGDITTYTYTPANAYTFTISGLNLTADLESDAIDEYFTVAGGTVLIKKLDTNDITLSPATLKFALEDDVLQAATVDEDAKFSKSGDAYVYIAASYKPWYELADTTITYHAASGGKVLFTLSGITKTDGIEIADNVVTLGKDNLTAGNVTIDGDYTLALDADYSVKTATEAYLEVTADGAKYHAAGKTEGWSVADNAIVYTAAQLGEVLVDIGGTKNFAVESNVITLNAGDITTSATLNTLPENSTVSLSGDWSGKTLNGNENATTIKFAEDVTGIELKNFSGKLEFASDVTATAYENDALKVTAGDQVITVSGLAAPSRADNTWLNATTYGKAAGSDYAADGKIITYTATDEETYFTLSGLLGGVTVDEVKAAITVDDGKVTFNSANVLDAAKTVSIAGDGYTLDVADEIKSSAQEVSWTASTGTYLSAGYNEGWRVDDSGKLIHQADDRDRFSISGLKTSTALGTDIIVEGKAVTLKDTALNNQNVTLTGNYTLALSGVSSPQIKSATWSGTTYRSSYIGAAGYILSGKTVTYTAATSPSDLFSLSGTTSTSGFNVSKSGDTYTVRVSNNALNNSGTVSIVNNTVDAKFAYASDFTGNKEQTLESAASFVNGVYTSEIYGKWSELNDTTFTIHPATTPTTFNITGLKNDAALGTDITVSGNIVTVNESAPDMTATETYSVKLTGDDYTLKFNGTTTATEVPANFTDGNYTSAYTKAYFTGSGNEFNFVPATTPDTFNITGLKDSVTLGTDIVVEDKEVTVNESALDMTATETYSVKLTGDNFTLNFQGSTSSTEIPATLVNGTYTSSYTPAHFSGSGNEFTFTPATTPTTFTISGLKNSAALNENVFVDGQKVTVNATALDNQNISVTAGYELELSGVETSANPTTTNALAVDGTTTTYNQKTTTNAYWNKTAANAYEFKSADEKTTELFKLTGVQNISESNITGNVITLGAANVVGDVTLTGDYTLARGEGLDAPKSVSAKYSDGTLTTSGKSAGYELSDNTISYVAATTKTIEFTGVDDDAVASNFWINPKATTEITIGKAAVKTDGTPVKILTEGYTLVLGKGMAAPKSVDAKYSDGTYTTAGLGAGYVLTDDSITYTSATTQAIQFSGLASDTTVENFHVDGTTITLDSAAIGSGTVELLTDGYTLALGDLDTPKSVSAKYSDNVYTTSGKSAGYELEEKSVSYVEATTKEIKFSGVDDDATASNFWINPKAPTEITIGKAAVKTDGTPVELLTEGYTLKLGKGMSTPKSNVTSLKGGVYSYFAQGAGYELEEKSITYSASDPNLQLRGISSKPATPADGVVNLTADNFSDLSIVSNDEFKFSIGAGDYSGKTFTGSASSDTVTNAGANLFVSLGASADSIVNSGSNVTVNAGYGDDYLLNTGENISVFGGGGNDTIRGDANVNVADRFVGGAGNDSLYGGAGADTLSGGTGNDKIFGGAGNDSILGDDGNDSLSGGAGDDTVLGGKGNDTVLGGTGNDTLSGEAGNDSLSGGAGNDSLSGGTGNDKLWGGAGNDTLLGGAGDDVFIYKPGEGTDRIFGYESGELIQLVNSSGKAVAFTKSNYNSLGNLLITVSGGGTVIVRDVTTDMNFNINGTNYSIGSDNKLK